jgi:uncharacterized protein (DUF58 family)
MAVNTFSSLRLNATQQRWLTQHVTLQRMLILLSVAIFLMAWNRGLDLLYGMFSLICAVLIYSAVSSRWQLRNLTAQMELPVTVAAGEELVISCHLNASDRHGLLLSCPAGFIVRQHIADGAFIRLQGYFRQRGVYLFHHLQLDCIYPFAVSRVKTLLPLKPCECLVTPRIHVLQQLPNVSDGREDNLAHGYLMRSSSQGDMAALREYRRGDSQRHIHWRASARHGELRVKEFEEPHRPALILVVNMSPELVLQDAFCAAEHSLEVLASLLKAASEADWPCVLVVSANGREDIRVHGRQQNLFAAMESLTRLEFNGQQNYSAVLQAARQRYPAGIIVSVLPKKITTPPRISGQHIDIRFDVASYSHEQSSGRILRRKQGARQEFVLDARSDIKGIFNA